MKKMLFFLLLLIVRCAYAADKGNIYVVVAGVSNYQSISSLILPEKDAKAIAALYKVQTQHVILLTGKYATRARILQSLKDQFARASEDDMVVFSFSGHGYAGGICPYDMSAQEGSGISYHELQRVLKLSRAKRKFVFLDACFSGGIRGNASPVNSHPETDSNVLLFLSSRTSETSIETPFMVNGIFTTYLLKGLRGGADSNGDRKIGAKELYRFVSQKVIDKSNDKQHPVMWGKFDDNTVVMDWSSATGK